MNILEVSNRFGTGGTEKTLQIFCKYLDRSIYNVYACGFLGGGIRLEEISKYTKEVFLPNGNEQKLIEILGTNHIDILHWHDIPVGKGLLDKTLAILLYCRQNNITVVETSPFSTFNKEKDALVDLRLFVSKTSLLKFYIKYGSNISNYDKYYYLYNPLDIERFSKLRVSALERNALRQAHGIRDNDFVIGKVCRPDLWKWDDVLLDALPQLIKAIPNLKIVIRAIPPVKKDKILKMKLAHHFVFLPESVLEKDLADTYQLLDVLVHTSRIGESFGVTLAEAMFFGVPILTNSTDFKAFTIFARDNSQTEIVENGVNGFIFKNKRDLIEKLLLLKNNVDFYKKISKNNTRKATTKFNARVLTNKLDSFINGSRKFQFDFEKEDKEYDRRVTKEPVSTLITINLRGIYDKLRYIR